MSSEPAGRRPTFREPQGRPEPGRGTTGAGRLEPVERRGLLFVVSAPSGTGKTTLVERLIEGVPNLRMSRSYTSRPVRAGEIDGVDYHFISRARFDAMIGADEFMESADVFGNLYGTALADTERVLARGEDLVLVIDVQGARQVRERGIPATSIFVLPPSFAILERRLRGRSQDDEAQIRRRLAVAREEVGAFREYDYLVINDEVESAVERLRSIVIAERASRRAMGSEAERIIETFADDRTRQARSGA
ncbi:MAG: guanylate kinase [Acidobacteria bacterium]|nr:guanylate kinase [Acidobacteriota bacterium]